MEAVASTLLALLVVGDAALGAGAIEVERAVFVAFVLVHVELTEQVAFRSLHGDRTTSPRRPINGC